MKKIIAILMSLALILGCFGAAMAEEEDNGKVAIGTISINGAFTLQCGLPEGYRVVPRRMSQDLIQALILSDVAENPIMQLSVAFDETYSDVDRMNDLTEEDLAVLEKSFTDVDPTVEITYGDTGLGTRLLIARQSEEAIDYIDFLSIYKGYFIEFALVPSPSAPNKNLSDEQLAMCIDFLTDLDFVPVSDKSAVRTETGARYIANLSDYDADSNTLKAVIRKSVPVDAGIVAELKAGDTLDVGEMSLTIEEMESVDEDYIDINDGEYSLRRSGDVFYLYMYEAEYLEDLAEMTVAVPEKMVFLDGIDPETGEYLMEDTVHTAEEFIQIISGKGSEFDPGFASDNTYVIFDEAGNLNTVQRFYAPWQ